MDYCTIVEEALRASFEFKANDRQKAMGLSYLTENVQSFANKLIKALEKERALEGETSLMPKKLVEFIGTTYTLSPTSKGSEFTAEVKDLGIQVAKWLAVMQNKELGVSLKRVIRSI